MTKGKPLVVLAGWLGCQKRSLRRYERLFGGHGYQVLSTIASPNMVVESCFRQLPPSTLQSPPRWDRQDMHVENVSTMQDFAWDLLRDVHHRNSDYWIFYAFSNGGCFVWEQVRRILNQPIETQAVDKEQFAVVRELKETLSGVIFDSCPSRQLAGIGYALKMCTLSERTEVMMANGMDVAFFPSALAAEKRKIANVRGASYYDGLLKDPSTVPQLYLYSESDAMIPSQPIDELYEHRRNSIGSDLVFCQRFEKSRHCAHFIDAPDEYRTAVDAFLEICKRQSAPMSKL